MNSLCYPTPSESIIHDHEYKYYSQTGAAEFNSYSPKGNYISAGGEAPGNTNQ